MFNSQLNMKSVRIPAILALLAFHSPVKAEPHHNEEESAKQINAANTLVREGKFDEAIKTYHQVAPNAVEQERLNYNLAVAEYRNGNIDSAEKLFTDASSSADAAIASSSRYNLGNCMYSKGLRLAETDKAAAITQLEQAISHYRGSLRSNPENTDARANIELAGEMIRKLKEQQKQEEEQKQNQQQQGDQQQENQQQDQKDQEQSDKGQQEQKDQQNNDQQQNAEGSEPQNDQSPDQQDPQQEETTSQSEQSQSDQKQENESQSDANNEPTDQQKSDEQSKQQPDQVSKEQSNPQNSGEERPQNQSQVNPQSSKEQNQKSAAAEEHSEKDDQSVPNGELTSANEQKSNAQADGSAFTTDPNAKDGMMSKEEALKMLQAVRDRDMLRRLQQEQMQRSRHVPVTKDW